MTPFLHRFMLGLAFLVGFQFSATAQGGEGDEAFARASKIYEYGRNSKEYYESRSALQTSANSFRNFLRNHPGHPERETAFYRMAVAQLLIGETASAEANFKMLIDRYQTGQLVAAAAYRMGAQRYNEEDFRQAQRYFRIAARQSNKESLRYQALYQQARCLMLTGDKKEALEPLRRLVGQEGNAYQETGRLALAHILFELGDYQESFDQFQTLAKKRFLEPDTKAEAILYSGLAASQLGQEDLAFRYILQTIDTPGLKDSYKARAQKELIEIYFRREQYDEVIAMYEKGFFQGEVYVVARAHLLAGYALLKKNQYQRAAATFESAAQLVPKSSLSFEASYRALYAYYQLGSVIVPDLAEAFLKNYKGYKKQAQWHQMARLFRAESQYKGGEVEEAAKSYRGLKVSALPTSLRANTLYKRAICFAEAGDKRGAIDSFNELITDHQYSPLLLEARVRKGRAYLEKGDYSRAVAEFETVLRETPASPFCAVALQGKITAHQMTREYGELIDATQLLLSKFPQLNPQARAHAHYWLGWGYFKSEEFDLAIPQFERARELSPEFYKEPAGTRILLSAYYVQDAEKMKKAALRIEKDVPGKFFPPKMMAWLGIHCFQQGDYQTSARILGGLANFEEPLETPIDVWRHLAKSELELANFKEASQAVEFVVAREEESFWKADALLDHSQALLGLEAVDEAIATAQEGLQYEPKGAVAAGLRFSLAEGKERKGEYGAAREQYEQVSTLFASDRTIAPYSLWKLAHTSEKLGDPVAASYRAQLEKEYPSWTPPQ